ncbi:MAG: hypothetical protein EAZ92_17350 [Candidatus Kapaibacterium sp.]|nr:MAG: hypothetical protein EAZ92_17350 [Candidatus Kapabacteria bacterium]
MAIFQLVDSQRGVLIIANDADTRSARNIALLCQEHSHIFRIFTENPIDSAWRGIQNHVFNNIDDTTSFSAHIVVDCNLTVHEEAEYLTLIDEQSNSTIISLSPSMTSAALARIYGSVDVVRINLLSGFFPKMQTVEFAPALQMSEEHKYQVVHFLESVGLHIEEIQDVVGFITPRIVAMLANEAAFAVMEATATVSDIDAAMKLGTNYPLGPLQWADEIGIDVVVAILDALFAEYHQERYRVCRLLRQYMNVGLLGKSVGAGFYSYNSGM